MQKRRSSNPTAHGVAEVRNHAHGMSESVRELADAVKDLLIDKLGDMVKRAVALKDCGEELAKETSNEVRDEIEERIQAKPYQALLIVAGAGLLLGLILRRR